MRLPLTFWRSPAAALLAGGILVPLCHAESFAALSMRIERNLSDKDHEVVIEITGGEIGLVTLKIVTPDGRTLLDMKAPDSKLGLRHLVIESPEPKNLALLQQDYPEGTYQFSATTRNGTQLSGSATLDHRMPEPVRWQWPSGDNAVAAPSGVTLKWAPVQGARWLALAIEDEKTGVKVLQTQLPGGAVRYSPPTESLRPGTPYKVSVGAIGAGGNASYVEATFTTAKATTLK